MHHYAPATARQQSVPDASTRVGERSDRSETELGRWRPRGLGSGAAPPATPPSSGGGAAQPIQLFSIPDAFGSAIRKIPKVDKGLNKLNRNRNVRKAAKVAKFLGFKIPFVDRPKPAGEGGGGQGECCESPFPKNRHDASEHDPEANKAGDQPAGEDQTAPAAAAASSPPATDAPVNDTPAAGPPATESAGDAAPAPPAKKASDLDKGRKMSEARRIFEATPAKHRSIKTISERTRAHFERAHLVGNRLRPTRRAEAADMAPGADAGPAPSADPAASQPPSSEPTSEPPSRRASAADRISAARQDRLNAALTGSAPTLEPPARRRRVEKPPDLRGAVRSQLGAAGVGRSSVLASAQQDMHGRQADRFQLHLDAAEGRKDFQRPQRAAARQAALSSLMQPAAAPAAD